LIRISSSLTQRHCCQAAFHELRRFIASAVGWDEVMADLEQRAWVCSDPALYDALWAALELVQFRAMVAADAQPRRTSPRGRLTPARFPFIPKTPGSWLTHK